MVELRAAPDQVHAELENRPRERAPSLSSQDEEAKEREQEGAGEALLQAFVQGQVRREEHGLIEVGQIPRGARHHIEVHYDNAALICDHHIVGAHLNIVAAIAAAPRGARPHPTVEHAEDAEHNLKGGSQLCELCRDPRLDYGLLEQVLHEAAGHEGPRGEGELGRAQLQKPGALAARDARHPVPPQPSEGLARAEQPVELPPELHDLHRHGSLTLPRCQPDLRLRPSAEASLQPMASHLPSWLQEVPLSQVAAGPGGVQLRAPLLLQPD
mmetsp:Transcript_63625/g.169942  ORF Transcript_63625/g.169942 Transcript_63625/m.169942 type:complete len:270 (+) Transcript_63625:208-1017(+)